MQRFVTLSATHILTGFALLLGLVSPAIGIAQSKRLPGLELAPGDTTTPVFPLIRIYKSPSANSPLVGQASAGQIFVVKQKTDVSAEFDGIQQFWYEVAFGKKLDHTGFVFGPGLACGFVQTSDGTQFVLHVIESLNEGLKQVDIKVVTSEGPLVTFSNQIPITADDSLVVRRRDSFDFHGYTDLIVFDFLSTECPDRHREMGVLWNGDRALQMPVLAGPEGSKSPCFRYQYVLPDEPGGEPGMLKIRVQKTATQQEWVKFRLIQDFGFVEIRN